MGEKFEKAYRMPMTLEKHFEHLREQSDDVNELYSIYELTKKRLEKEMPDSRQVYFSFSYHDASHSRAIIRAIERFLGEKRIVQLSPTDTFMLLVCAYAHDYGMIQTYSKIIRILQSDDFTNFLYSIEDELNALEKEDAVFIKKLLYYLHEGRGTLPLDVLYRSIMTALQMYLRPNHWKGVEILASEYEGLFESHLKGRFVNGIEGLVNICMCHGKPFDSVMKLHQTAFGFAGDDYHPRFIAAMLRLGDLLDLDNNRFPRWLMQEIKSQSGNIPKESELHARKHESITHLLINDEIIEIEADCSFEKDGYPTADLISEWTEWLKEECNHLVLHWNEISQPDFGRPPSNILVNIRVDGNPYESHLKNLQMQMSQNHFMKLLEGFSIYSDKYVGIRELVQNAVDASLLQLWKDIRDNRYSTMGLSKDDASGGLKLLDLLKGNRYSVFGNYDITVEVIKDLEAETVIMTVKDKGIGISKDEVQYILDIGSSSENNPRRRELMKDMPEWLRPAGVFGIGLQSVFQITDCIDFFTRQPNQPEVQISLFSYGKSKGKVKIQELPPNKDGKQFFDNAVPGTNVKITINPEKVFLGNSKRNGLEYFDPEFDSGNPLDILYVEMCKICRERLKTVKRDYFNIIYKEIIINKDGTVQPKKENERPQERMRWTYFLGTNKNIDNKSKDLRNTIKPLLSSQGTEQPAFSFESNNAVYYWDEQAKRAYYLKVRPCSIKEKDGEKRVYFPEPSPNIYKVSYKFNPISSTESIYTYRNKTQRHAGFLSWEILILDGDPTKYLNIDRERLKDGAITEAELLQVRSDILNAWCSFFINGTHGKDSKEKKEEYKRTTNRFNKDIGSLVSLMILFYLNVPKDDFQEFLKRYGSLLDDNKYVFGKESIHLKNLINQDMVYYTEYDIPKCIDSDKSFTADIVETKSAISDKTLYHFPHRLIQIDKIEDCSNNRYRYIFKFKTQAGSLSTVSLSNTCRYMDYAMAFDLYDDTYNVKYESIKKKDFKPDENYTHIVINCFPSTFSKGKNFSLHIDECIRCFILSPFDKASSNHIKDYLCDPFAKNEMVDEIVAYVISSEQYKKCVNYILKKRYSSRSNKKKIKKNIETDYRKFITNFCITLKNNSSSLRDVLIYSYHLGENDSV